MDPVEQLKELPEAERLQQLERMLPRLDAAQLTDIANYFDALGVSRDVVEFARVRADASEPELARVEAEQRRTSEVVQAGQEAGASESQTRAALQAEGIDPVTAGLDMTDPVWVMDSFGRALTDEERQEFLNLWNGVNDGPDFQTYEELVASGAIDRPAGQVEQIVQMAVGEREPYPTLSIGISRGKEFTVRSGEWEEASSRYGFSSDEMTRIVRMADMNNMRGADGEYVAWQPLAALMKTTGALDENARRVASSERIKELNAEVTKLIKMTRVDVGGAAGATMQRQLADAKARRDAEVARLRGLMTGGVSPRALADSYNEGLNLYGYDPGMAFIHATDQGLAARFASAGGDADKISRADQALMLRYLGNAGYTSEDDFARSIITQGYTEAGLVGSFLQDQQRRYSSGGGGATRVLPDPVQVQQAAKDLYRSLFKEEPDEGTLTSLASQVSAAISGAGSNQNVDVEARIRQSLEGLPQYEEFYGNKPDGMTEGEYQGQFVSAQRSILGDELGGNAAVRLGMRSGQYQTAVGAATGTREAWGNSSWLGRLAQAAQSVARNT